MSAATRDTASSAPPEAPADPVRALLDEVARQRPAGPAQNPTLGMTSYEQVWTLLITVVGILVLIVAGLGAKYAATRPPAPATVAQLEFFEEDPGGSPDGSPDETLRVDSPYEERPDAALVDNPSDEPSQVEAAAESLMEFSENAAGEGVAVQAAVNPEQQQFILDAQNTGRKGSATGTGRRGLGFGNGKRGFPRDQRWFISFSDRESVAEYARQLDFFGIELGAVFPDRIVYLSQMSGAVKQRVVTSGKEENRLYMNWQGGSRRLADIEIFRNAGIDAEQALVLHFYPQNTEAVMAKLEREASERPVDQIRRTYFVVRHADKGYAFEVTRVVYSL